MGPKPIRRNEKVDKRSVPKRHGQQHAARAMDILRLAFALQLGATGLLSFDENQRRVEPAEGRAGGP